MATFCFTFTCRMFCSAQLLVKGTSFTVANATTAALCETRRWSRLRPLVHLALPFVVGVGGVRSLSHLAPLMTNLQCWVSPKQFAMSRAGDAYDAQGQLTSDANRASVQGVVDKVLWATDRLNAPE